MKMLTLIFSLVLVTTCIVVEAQVCDILNPCKSWQRCDNGGCVEDTRTCEDDPCIVGPKECYNRLSSSDSNRYVCKCNLDDDVYDHGRGTAYSGAHCSSIHSVNHVQQCYGIQCTTGSFQSPNYPQDHHDNEAVLYLLYIPGAKRIKFRFDEPFYIEKSKDELFIGPGLTCPNAGNLNPDNGTTVDGGNYYLIEGDTAPQHDIIMEGDSAFLYWKTDRTLTFDGWKIRWTAEEIDPCQSEPCMNQGTCQTNAVTGRDVTYDDYTCMCLPCYSGRTCQTYTSPCLSVPCQNAGTCEPKADAPCEYTCTCTDCYLGEQCENLNDQACFPNPCANGGTCSVSPASCRVAICECLGCYTGSTCSQLQDPCSVNPCLNSGQCIATSCTDYRCQCQGCWTGERCSVFGDPCQDSPCQNSGYCIASAGSCTEYQCQCRGCFTGDNCETTMDPCRDDPCMNGGTCTNLGCENRVCTCQGCYTGEDCQILQDPCSPNTCLNGGTCIALGCTVSQCQCPTCYLGTSCERLQDPCAANPCVNGGVCLQQSGSCTAYQCQCFGCWTGTNCQTAQNPCQPNPCRNNGVCNQLACTAYQCTCSGCYTGTQCETLQNPCSPNPCQNGDFCWQQSCTSYTCLCTGQCYTGTNCETLLDPCSPNPCQNGGRCSPSGCENHFCSCVNCYTGSNCETLQDPCANSPCQNGGVCNAETCTRYSCTCSDSCWTGPNCQLRVNPCDANPCRNGGICQQVAGSCTLYECICSNCWSGPTCSELLNPCDPNPCSNGGTCVQDINSCTSYTCTCQECWTGTTCTTRVNPCDEIPCRNGRICQQVAGSCMLFECTCRSGSTCSEGAIIGAVIAVIVLLVLFVILFILIRKRRLKKSAMNSAMALLDIAHDTTQPSVEGPAQVSPSNNNNSRASGEPFFYTFESDTGESAYTELEKVRKSEYQPLSITTSKKTPNQSGGVEGALQQQSLGGYDESINYEGEEPCLDQNAIHVENNNTEESAYIKLEKVPKSEYQPLMITTSKKAPDQQADREHSEGALQQQSVGGFVESVNYEGEELCLDQNVIQVENHNTGESVYTKLEKLPKSEYQPLTITTSKKAPDQQADREHSEGALQKQSVGGFVESVNYEGEELCPDQNVIQVENHNTGESAYTKLEKLPRSEYQPLTIITSKKAPDQQADREHSEGALQQQSLGGFVESVNYKGGEPYLDQNAILAENDHTGESAYTKLEKVPKSEYQPLTAITSKNFPNQPGDREYSGGALQQDSVSGFVESVAYEGEKRRLDQNVIKAVNHGYETNITSEGFDQATDNSPPREEISRGGGNLVCEGGELLRGTSMEDDRFRENSDYENAY